MVQRGDERLALLLFADAVEAYGMDPLEDVPAFPVVRHPPMRLDEALNLLERRDDPLLAGLAS